MGNVNELSTTKLLKMIGRTSGIANGYKAALKTNVVNAFVFVILLISIVGFSFISPYQYFNKFINS